MSIGSLLRRLLGSRGEDPPSRQYHEDLTRASEHLAEIRGDRITAMPAANESSSIENVQSAAKDYGLSRFSGETDALEDAADAYRSASRRKK